MGYVEHDFTGGYIEIQYLYNKTALTTLYRCA